MENQALVIGLGQFGMAVAQALSEKGIEVIALDRKKQLVDTATAFAAESLVMDATDEHALARLEPGRRELCICAIGDESRESSILCTALLRQQGAPRVFARATDFLHARILRLVGAHLVINPEREFGFRLANQLIYERVVSDMPLGHGLQITEVRIPPSFAGKTLMELNLPRNFGVTVVGVRAEDGRPRVPVDPKTPLIADELLMIVSDTSSVGRLLESIRE